MDENNAGECSGCGNKEDKDFLNRASMLSNEANLRESQSAGINEAASQAQGMSAESFVGLKFSSEDIQNIKEAMKSFTSLNMSILEMRNNISKLAESMSQLSSSMSETSLNASMASRRARYSSDVESKYSPEYVQHIKEGLSNIEGVSDDFLKGGGASVTAKFLDKYKVGSQQFQDITKSVQMGDYDINSPNDLYNAFVKENNIRELGAVIPDIMLPKGTPERTGFIDQLSGMNENEKQSFKSRMSGGRSALFGQALSLLNMSDDTTSEYFLHTQGNLNAFNGVQLPKSIQDIYQSNAKRYSEARGSGDTATAREALFETNEALKGYRETTTALAAFKASLISATGGIAAVGAAYANYQTQLTLSPIQSIADLASRSTNLSTEIGGNLGGSLGGLGALGLLSAVAPEAGIPLQLAMGGIGAIGGSALGRFAGARSGVYNNTGDMLSTLGFSPSKNLVAAIGNETGMFGGMYSQAFSQFSPEVARALSSTTMQGKMGLGALLNMPSASAPELQSITSQLMLASRISGQSVLTPNQINEQGLQGGTYARFASQLAYAPSVQGGHANINDLAQQGMMLNRRNPALAQEFVSYQNQGALGKMQSDVMSKMFLGYSTDEILSGNVTKSDINKNMQLSPEWLKSLSPETYKLFANVTGGKEDTEKDSLDYLKEIANNTKVTAEKIKENSTKRQNTRVSTIAENNNFMVNPRYTPVGNL